MIELFGDRVLLALPERKRKSDGGIHLPDTANLKEDVSFYEVISVAVGDHDFAVKVSDQVLTNGGFGGFPVKIDGKDCLVVKEEDIIGRKV